MNGNDRIVVVTGATGQQGGAVTTRLLADGWRVRAITRDPAAAKARELAAAGAEVVAADQLDRDSLAPPMRGAYGVFSVQAGPMAPGQDEYASGKNVIDAAREADVEHIVYSSGADAERTSSFGLQPAKWALEQYLGDDATILRPASFMENLVHPVWGLHDGKLTTAIRGDLRQPLIALDDIAAFTALALANPGDFRETLELAGDVRTPIEQAAAMAEMTGLPITYEPVPLDAIRARSETGARGFELLNSGEVGSRADVAALRARHPGLLTFDGWLAAKGAALVKRAAS
ncbi:NmrA family NAD(P)-binding protein [Amycolatopsis minnesotensis]|uniref:NmrA/HSCARG family protein n=1 Tax=Amycolatopsis minnesotensis TaxID=337894 RepID=A0ABN2QLF5_9PSEU